MITVRSAVFTAPRTDSLLDFEHDEARLAPYLRKLEETFAEEFKMPRGSSQDAYHGASLSDRREIILIIRELRALAFDRSMSIQERADAYLRMIDRCRPYARATNRARLYADYASLLPRLRRIDEMPKYLDLSVQAAIQAGDLETASQSLGTLGSYYSQAGDHENMRRAWNQGLRLGREAQSWQEARILSFYSFFYLNQGRLALSRELLRGAEERCRELGAYEVEIRFLLNEVSYFSDWECWPLMGPDLERADELLRQAMEGQWSVDDRKHWTNQVHKFRAIYLSATGSCAAAETMASDVLKDLPNLRMTPVNVASRVHIAQALRRCGRLKPALAALDEGERLARENGIPEVLEYGAVEKAEVCLALGDVQGCRRALETGGSNEDKAKLRVSRDAIRRDVLSIRMARMEGNDVLARRLLADALRRLKKQRARLDLSPDAAMALPAAAELGDLAHDLLDTSAKDGYAREMEWRAGEAGLPSAGTQGRRGWTEDALQRLSKRNAVHCVFRVQKDRVLRWTAYHGRVVRDEILIEPADLAQRVLSFCKALQEEKGELNELSRQLAVQLLPTSVLESQGPSLLLVTRDGPLDQLPFEALNVSPTGYASLLSQCEVAYVLFDRSSSPSAEGRAVIVSQPTYPADLARRYSILTERLTMGEREASNFSQIFKDPLSLSGSSATKRNLLESWSQAPALYFACHVIRDSEIPYIMFLPLARDSADIDEASYLDIADIRSADLSRCRLVVLSSCGTGVGYMTGRISVPSLADGFVQAGARAVVHTSWAVHDEDAAKLMNGFETLYGKSSDPVSALNQTRRELIQKNAAPKVWAAYSITLGSL